MTEEFFFSTQAIRSPSSLISTVAMATKVFVTGAIYGDVREVTFDCFLFGSLNAPNELSEQADCIYTTAQ